MVSGYDKTPPPDDQQPQIVLPWSFWAGCLAVAVIFAVVRWLGII